MLKANAVIAIAGLAASLIYLGCGTGVEPSPSPGIIRVTLKANELDTTIVIRSDTTRFSRWDSFILYISQGLLYRGKNYATLYRDISNARIVSDTVNIIGRQWLNGVPITSSDTSTITTANSRYIKHVIFETYVPPGAYNRLEMNLNGTEVDTYIPKLYQNPIRLPDSTSPIIGFEQSYTVNEGRTTEINLEIDPFQSLTRYRDLYLFSRKMRIVSVNQF
jgi:hypothetical protein